LQGAWSLTLNRLFGFQDTVFGAAVAGRPPEILGVESIIGSFVNNVPVRVRMPRDVSLRDWLNEMQRTQHKRANFEYVSPAVIQQWSELPVGESMFDALVVTLGATGQAEDSALNLRPLAGHIRTAYPLTVSIGETNTQISIRVELQPDRQCKVSLRKLLSEYETTLRYLATSAGEDTIGSLPGFSGGLESVDYETVSAQRPFESSNQSASIDNQEGREDADIDIMQDALRSEWQLALGITDIKPDDDFFELGGSSLQAATMHARIESVTRKSIPLLMLFSATTLREMSEILARGSWPLRSELAIGLRTDGSKSPLFCVASPEVNTVGYALLAQYQADDRPVYVLQAPPDEKIMRRLSPVDIPAVATVYLRELQRIQPNGPYYLIGMCTGSQILLEIARQLRDEGERTAFAGIINTWAHYTVSRAYAVQRLLNTGRWYTDRLHELWRLSAAEQLAELLRVARVRLSSLTLRSDDKDKGLRQTSKHEAERMQASIDHSSEGIARATQQFSDPWIEDFGWASKDPEAEKYAGTLTVFRIKRQQFWRTGEEDLGWGKHADNVRVEHLPAQNHNDVLRQPHVQVIAKRVADLIREVEEKDDP
jgi:thioesterase domain-containing protein